MQRKQSRPGVRNHEAQVCCSAWQAHHGIDPLFWVGVTWPPIEWLVLYERQAVWRFSPPYLVSILLLIASSCCWRPS